MNIYIGCGLTHVPRDIFENYCATIHDTAKFLVTNYDYNVNYALVDSDPQLGLVQFEERAKYCFKWDKEMVQNANLMIAEVSFPSLGLGIELGIAESLNIPTILCFKDYSINKATHVDYTNPDGTINSLQIGEGYISLMALGMPNIIGIIKYNSIDSLFEMLNSHLKKFS